MNNAENFGLEDLDPRGAIIEVKVKGQVHQLQLRKFSLRSQIWVKREFGSAERFTENLNPESKVNIEGDQIPYIETLLKTVHHLLDENGKEIFPDWESLADEVGSSFLELLQLQKAIAVTMGMSQPLIDKIDQDFKKKVTKELEKVTDGIR